MRGLLGGGRLGHARDRLRQRRLRLCWLLLLGMYAPDSGYEPRVEEFVRELALCGAGSDRES